MNVADHTDNQWVTCFHDTAEAILGAPADDIAAMRDTVLSFNNPIALQSKLTQ